MLDKGLTPWYIELDLVLLDLFDLLDSYRVR